MELREPAQEVEVVPAPGANIVEIVATGDRRTDDQQHHLLERIHHPPRLPVIAKLGKMLQQNGHARPRGLLVQDRIRQGEHALRSMPNQSAPGFTIFASRQNYPKSPFNLRSPPCATSFGTLRRPERPSQ